MSAAIAVSPLKLAVVGLESRYVHEALDILRRSGREVSAFLRSRYDCEISADLPFAPTAWDWAVANPGAPFTVPLLTPGRRKRTVDEALAAGLAEAAPIVDPTSVVSPTTSFGDGSVVNALAAIGAWCRIGRQSQINRTASLGHDIILGDFVTIGPNATLCGGCELGDGVFVGGGATLAPKVKIGRNTIVGAGATVTRDIPEHALAVGNPARIVREGVAGYRDISV